jgi:hypothetical protein
VGGKDRHEKWFTNDVKVRTKKVRSSAEALGTLNEFWKRYSDVRGCKNKSNSKEVLKDDNDSNDGLEEVKNKPREVQQVRSEEIAHQTAKKSLLAYETL